MKLTAICNTWRAMAAPINPKARQLLLLRAARREAAARDAAGVRELVNGRWIVPAPSYFQHMARQQRV